MEDRPALLEASMSPPNAACWPAMSTLPASEVVLLSPEPDTRSDPRRAAFFSSFSMRFRFSAVMSSRACHAHTRNHHTSRLDPAKCHRSNSRYTQGTGPYCLLTPDMPCPTEL